MFQSPQWYTISSVQGNWQADTNWMVQTYWQWHYRYNYYCWYITSNSNGKSCAVCCSHSVVGLALVWEDSTVWQHLDPLSWTAWAHDTVISKQLIGVHLWITISTNRASEVQKASKTSLVLTGSCWQLYILWFDWKEEKEKQTFSNKFYM